jgi:Na+/H+-dicarboxylate symporter
LRRDLSGAGGGFIAQYAGIDLTFDKYLIIALASVLGSFGTAGVPGTAVIMATVVLSAAGLPLEAIGYLYASTASST